MIVTPTNGKGSILETVVKTAAPMPDAGGLDPMGGVQDSRGGVEGLYSETLGIGSDHKKQEMVGMSKNVRGLLDRLKMGLNNMAQRAYALDPETGHHTEESMKALSVAQTLLPKVVEIQQSLINVEKEKFRYFINVKSNILGQINRLGQKLQGLPDMILQPYQEAKAAYFKIFQDSSRPSEIERMALPGEEASRSNVVVKVAGFEK